MPDRHWWKALWPDPLGVLRALGVEPGMTVVDLCCGDGYFTAPLAALVEGRVYGVDLDPGLLDLARGEIEHRGGRVRQWICGDARDLPELLAQQIDFVLLAKPFHGVPEKTLLARSVATVLRPGGRFAIVNWHPLAREQTVVFDQPRGPQTHMRMTPEQVRAVVEPAGFTLDRIVELPPYHYGAIFRKTTGFPVRPVD
jgi:ubiquinone/menaquinone biosynthesis C-methylase UbiE